MRRLRRSDCAENCFREDLLTPQSIRFETGSHSQWQLHRSQKGGGSSMLAITQWLEACLVIQDSNLDRAHAARARGKR